MDLCGGSSQGDPPTRKTSILLISVACDRKDEMAVAALIEELVLRQAPDEQAAEDEGQRAEAQILYPLLALDAGLTSSRPCLAK